METIDVRNQPLRASLVEHVSVNIAVFVVHVSSFVDVDPSYFVFVFALFGYRTFSVPVQV